MSVDRNIGSMPAICFNTDYDDCAPDKCKSFGIIDGCALRMNWSDPDLIKSFGEESMEYYWSTPEGKVSRLTHFLESE